MPLLNNLGVAQDDQWISMDDEADLPIDAPVIVSLTRWQTDREALSGRNAPLGIRLAPGEPAEAIGDDASRFDLIALPFPKFSDGRSYSTGRLLRERYGFNGELRAVGHVLQDQFLFMLRCGFSSFDVPKQRDVEEFGAAVRRIGIFFQPAADGRATAMDLRHRRYEAAAE